MNIPADSDTSLSILLLSLVSRGYLNRADIIMCVNDLLKSRFVLTSRLLKGPPTFLENF